MRIHVLRVFTSSQGEAGNPLGVVRAGHEVPETERRPLARALGFSETVFVDDPSDGSVRIFTPARELPFAGHPLVGTAWLLFRDGVPLASLHPPAGEVPCWRDEQDRVWIRGRPEWCPDFTIERFDHADDVDRLTGPPDGIGIHYAWAWEDEGAGRIRARMFAPELGVDEDEATGSAALRLGATIDRRLMIHQGTGSVICVVPGPDGTVDVGGYVRLDGIREGEDVPN